MPERSIAERALAGYALRVCQWVFQGPVYLVVWLWDRVPGGHAAQDCVDCWKDVEFSRLGYEDGELLIMQPAPRAAEAQHGFVLYVHGGGFACSSSFHYKHSLTFMVRAGYTVLCVDYPMAPQASFPAPQLAVLRALRAAGGRFPAMRSTGVHLVGDSAGANLALQASLALSCPAARRSVDRDGDLAGWWGTAPAARSVVSVYGMLDREDSVTAAALPVSLGLRFLWRAHAGDAGGGGAAPGSRAASLAKGAAEGPAAQRPAFADTLAALVAAGAPAPLPAFPPCLLCCGSRDFLLPSSELVHARLRALGCESTLKVYPGHHAFFGLPVGWTFHTCWTNNMPCSRTILDHLAGREQETPLDDFVRGPRSAIPRFEPVFPILTASQILVTIPVTVVACPLLVLWGARTAAASWG